MPVNFANKTTHLAPKLKPWGLISLFSMHVHVLLCSAKMGVRAEYHVLSSRAHYEGSPPPPARESTFIIKFISCTDLLCSEDCAIIFVGAWERKPLPSPGDELHISLTGHAVSEWDLEWEDGLMVMFSYAFELP